MGTGGNSSRGRRCATGSGRLRGPNDRRGRNQRRGRVEGAVMGYHVGGVFRDGLASANGNLNRGVDILGYSDGEDLLSEVLAWFM